ncbi:hypothetical protein CHS0354_000432 [Potamilus streckersoni]|uniref:Uncharacterized protein n=1 Tax=Potamilus streckersoni TaxID=2493646 RepID=A0AAE0T7I4_9BIVA|nr:hypothetical protein CHS0354_000432 [Potamilus streckersoni]
MNKEGHEITLSMLSEADFFGELSAIDGMPRAATVVALSPTTVFHITGAKFKELILSEIKIANALLLVLAERLRKTDEHINSLWQNGAYGKVAAALIRIAEDFGTIKQGSVDITGIASHKNIASYAAVTRETCSRAFAMFEKEGFIIKTRNNVTLTDYQAFKNRFKI